MVCDMLAIMFRTVSFIVSNNVFSQIYKQSNNVLLFKTHLKNELFLSTNLGRTLAN